MSTTPLEHIRRRPELDTVPSEPVKSIDGQIWWLPLPRTGFVPMRETPGRLNLLPGCWFTTGTDEARDVLWQGLRIGAQGFRDEDRDLQYKGLAVVTTAALMAGYYLTPEEAGGLAAELLEPDEQWFRLCDALLGAPGRKRSLLAHQALHIGSN